MSSTYKKEEQQLLKAFERYLGKPLDLLSATDLSTMRAQICGGAITSVFSNAAINDFDIYMESEIDCPRMAEFLKSYGFRQVFITHNAISFLRVERNRKYRIQLIRAFTGAPLEVFNTFDFTVCCGAYSFSDREFTLHERFLPDLAKRRLVYLGGSRYPICAMYRSLKYQKRGFILPGSTVMHLGLAISRLEITTYKELKEHLRGIDTMFLTDFLSSKSDEVPFEYGEFIAEAFERLDGTQALAETEDEE
jgi:hypothetical protein